MRRPRLGRGLRDLGVWPVPVPAADRDVQAADRDVQALDRDSPGVDRESPTANRDARAARTHPPIVICITSGKGGTGKSVLTSNLAVHLASSGVRVVAVDADLGLANLHLLLGVRPERSIMEVIEGGATVDAIVESGPAGVGLAAGVSGDSRAADLHPARLIRLVGAFDELAGIADLVLVDTGAGIGRGTTTFLYALEEVVVVTTPDVTAMTDGYMVLKNVARHNPRARLSIIVNRTESAVEGLEVFGRIERVCRKFLGRSPLFLGHVLEDRRVAASVAERIPIVLNQPAAPAAACLRGVGRALLLEVLPRRSAAPILDRGTGCV